MCSFLTLLGYYQNYTIKILSFSQLHQNYCTMQPEICDFLFSGTHHASTQLWFSNSKACIQQQKKHVYDDWIQMDFHLRCICSTKKSLLFDWLWSSSFSKYIETLYFSIRGTFFLPTAYNCHQLLINNSFHSKTIIWFIQYWLNHLWFRSFQYMNPFIMQSHNFFTELAKHRPTELN